MNNNDHNVLLKFARQALENYPNHIDTLTIKTHCNASLQKKQGSFVTLTEDGQLRGCIGSITPHRDLLSDIIDNAVSAGFSDPRFLPLAKDELDNVRIEISLLTRPKKLSYKNQADLLRKLGKEKPGIIIQKGPFKATFLPQVWEELPDAKDFLSHLCFKAGLPSGQWQSGKVDVSTYTAEVFHE